MTGHDEFSFAYQAIKIGVSDFLLKPFTQEEMERTLQRVCAKPTATAQSAMDVACEVVHNMNDGGTRYGLISQMIDTYLEQNYTKSNLSLSVIASDLQFDSGYLRKVYKTVRGITIIQKLESLRIEAAKALLKLGTYQVQQISEMIGFSDQFYFSKRFKQITGSSPTDYKEVG